MQSWRIMRCLGAVFGGICIHFAIRQSVDAETSLDMSQEKYVVNTKRSRDDILCLIWRLLSKILEAIFETPGGFNSRFTKNGERVSACYLMCIAQKMC